MARLRVLYVEPFDGGSHAAFTRTLRARGGAGWTVLTMPGRHWKWRMRGAAPWLVERHAGALATPHDVLLVSSFTSLADLVALQPALAALPKAVYFHENQWTYPVRDERERDHHFGFTQLISALAADLCLFNSQHNRDAFLRASREVVARMPDARPARSIDALQRRCEVMPVPLELPELEPAARADVPRGSARAPGPVLLWNHRWEHDKGPETFFDVLARLDSRGVPFRLLVCGEEFRDAPGCFAAARRALARRIDHWGFAADRGRYLELLTRAQIAVSTARHEFFGLSMLEATHAGAMPLVPDALAYPELFPSAHRYRDAGDLEERLAAACTAWVRGEIDLRGDRSAITAPVRAERVVEALLVRLKALRQSPRQSGASTS